MKKIAVLIVLAIPLLAQNAIQLEPARSVKVWCADGNAPVVTPLKSNAGKIQGVDIYCSPFRERPKALTPPK